MADLRIPPGAQLPSVTSAGAPARSEAVKAAQRAFFEAALNQAQQGETKSASVASPMRTPFASQLSETPTRIMRPGSFLDIKV